MKFILKFILTIILFAIGYFFAIQGVAPIYEDSYAEPFGGDYIYNPYQNVDFNKTVKANFHAHTQFDTREEFTEGEFEKKYADAGYGYIGVANHNFITNSLTHRDNYIPTYEHGWNVNNYHILVLDAKTNDILDSPFLVFKRSQMQWMINHLRQDASILSLNHPERFRLGSNEFYQYLRGYDLMEANSNNDRTVWDEVLMQGAYIPLLSSDDSHWITNLESSLQRAYTIVLSGNDSKSILNAVKEGYSYGIIGRGDTLGEPYHKFDKIKVDRDTLWVTLSDAPKAINLISNGEVFKSVKDTNKVVLPVSEIENYVRIEALYDNQTLVSNPIVESKDGYRPTALPVPLVDNTLTWLNRAMWWILTLIILWLIIRLWVKRKTNNRSKDNFENYTWGIGLKPYDPN